MYWAVRVFEETFGIVDFVELDADTEEAAMDAALDAKGPGWAAEFANPLVVYTPNTFTAM